MSAVDSTARTRLDELEARVTALEKPRYIPKEQAMIDRIAKLRAQRDTAVTALEQIEETDTHAGKVCGTCHSRIDLASQVINMARSALLIIEQADGVFDAARKLDRDSNPDREFELAAGEPAGRLPGDAAAFDNAVGTGGDGNSSEVPSEQPEGSSPEEPSGQSLKDNRDECRTPGCGNPAGENGYCDLKHFRTVT